MFELATLFHQEELAYGPLGIDHGPVEIPHGKIFFFVYLKGFLVSGSMSKFLRYHKHYPHGQKFFF